jgi:hypothetical protein
LRTILIVTSNLYLVFPRCLFWFSRSEKHTMQNWYTYPVEYHDATQIYRRCSGGGEQQRVTVNVRLSLHSQGCQHWHPVQNNSQDGSNSQWNLETNTSPLPHF